MGGGRCAELWDETGPLSEQFAEMRVVRAFVNREVKFGRALRVEQRIDGSLFVHHWDGKQP